MKVEKGGSVYWLVFIFVLDETRAFSDCFGIEKSRTFRLLKRSNSVIQFSLSYTSFL